jgi:hypothetical protein
MKEELAWINEWKSPTQFFDRTEPHKQGKVATNNERLNSILIFVKENKEKPIIRRSTSSPCRKHLKEHVA